MRPSKQSNLFAILLGALALSCAPAPKVVNPFTDLQPLEFGGLPQPLTSQITSLGCFSEGEVLEILVEAGEDRSVYVLKLDSSRSDAGVIIDGGPVNEPFLHRVVEEGERFLFVDAPVGSIVMATIKAGRNDFRKPAGQAIVLEFAPGFVVNGLFDPETNDDDDRAFLIAIEPIVREGILERLREIFANTPVTFLEEHESRPEESSRITFSGERVLGDDLDAVSVSGCPDQVVFGSVLPRGSNVDAGNQMLNDEAVVYTGSFRTTGDCDSGFIINSTNNIINTLALSAGHEAGHLLGLNHTALDGLMAAMPSQAFQRQLRFQRSQLVFDMGEGLEVFTNVIQDPQIYFDHIFMPN